MSHWSRPELSALQQVIRSSEGQLLLCSPYIRRDVLAVIQESLPEAVTNVEVWTKLSFRDWLVGASEPDGLLDLMDDIVEHGRPTTILHGDRLHAKVVTSHGSLALAGSANLTMGGYVRNQEIVRLVDGAEVAQLRNVVHGIRQELVPVPYAELKRFVTDCLNAVDTQEALLQLIRDELPAPESPALVTASLISYPEFWDFLDRSSSPVAKDILHIAKNRDGNNNTGKVKQAFFGVQRFLQEYPEHQEFVERLDDRQWFDLLSSHLVEDWIEFLHRFEGEVNSHHQYSIRTLRGYLPASSGGRLMGGGGGVGQFRRVWPFVGRIMREYREA